MKIKFIKPLPQITHTIPAGHILDAHPGFAQKMIRNGYAVAVDEVVPEVSATPEAKPAPVQEEKPVQVNAFEEALKAAHADDKDKAEEAPKATPKPEPKPAASKPVAKPAVSQKPKQARSRGK